MSPRLSGVIAAIATPVTPELAPDVPRFTKLAQYLLDNGCDGLNVLGTTGEATSFSFEQRAGVMRAAAAELDRSRLMVGTGAASLAEATALTRLAAQLGFAGALVLPPFYYKDIAPQGVLDYFSALIATTKAQPIPIYLYNFPALSGVPYTREIVARLIEAFPDRLAGLKDSSGDMPYARALAKSHPGFAVFPSTEAVLGEARSAGFAGCISATANLNSDLCGQAWRNGDERALERAVAIRKLFDGKPLVAGVKAGLAHIHRDERLTRPMPPLVEWMEAERKWLAGAIDEVRAGVPA
ncbi:MAG: 4-hydroxy-tetrahydrodipicolinate synthase [Methylobacteriaceae bacterium]|jgi:4-hydroxy-tetrahydrodipicolinate synthase|nr:4-hydroxy-tetrahydrodipicolinate synthase [Methylobacteriaceae bacterium]